MLEANDSATEEREHAMDGNMDVKTSGESTAQLLGCRVEAPLVGGEMAAWLCTGNSSETEAYQIDVRSGMQRRWARCRRVVDE
jgi:hypothetical protein